jgi:hypothetical protein
MSGASPPPGFLPPPPDPSLRPTPGPTYSGSFGDTITGGFQGGWGMPGSSPLYRPQDPPTRPSDCSTKYRQIHVRPDPCEARARRARAQNRTRKAGNHEPTASQMVFVGNAFFHRTTNAAGKASRTTGRFCQMNSHGPFCNCNRVQYCGPLCMDPLTKCDAKQRERAVRQEDAFKDSTSISMDALNKQKTCALTPRNACCAPKTSRRHLMARAWAISPSVLPRPWK